MPIKRILLWSNSPIAQYPAARQPWLDVLLRLVTKPGRRVVRLGPALVGRMQLERSRAWSRQLAVQHPELADEYGAEVAGADAVLTRLSAEARLVDTTDPLHARGRPQVYTAARFIDRAEADRMLRVLLATYGITRCRLTWGRPSLVIVADLTPAVRE